jgi:hypothetical protein
MWEIHKSGSERGVKFFYKAEYCGTPQSKERRNGEYKVCLNIRALRLLDHNVTLRSQSLSVPERGGFSKNSAILQLLSRSARHLLQLLLSCSDDSLFMDLFTISSG